MALYFSYKPIPSAAEFIDQSLAQQSPISEDFVPEFQGNVSDQYTGQEGSYDILSGMFQNNFNGNTFYAVKFDTLIRIQVRESVVNNILDEGYEYLESPPYLWEIRNSSGMRIYYTTTSNRTLEITLDEIGISDNLSS